MITIKIKTFDELTKSELYTILQLRSEVFVVEQDCVYQDIDSKDFKALHVFGCKGTDIVAYARVFDSGDYFDDPSIGRVVVKKSERNYSYGHDIMKASIKAVKDRFGKERIAISAQIYLNKFYQTHGFVSVGEDYLEDGIPHVRMIKN